MNRRKGFEGEKKKNEGKNRNKRKGKLKIGRQENRKDGGRRRECDLISEMNEEEEKYMKKKEKKTLRSGVSGKECDLISASNIKVTLEEFAAFSLLDSALRNDLNLLISPNSFSSLFPATYIFRGD